MKPISVPVAVTVDIDQRGRPTLAALGRLASLAAAYLQAERSDEPDALEVELIAGFEALAAALSDWARPPAIDTVTFGDLRPPLPGLADDEPGS